MYVCAYVYMGSTHTLSYRNTLFFIIHLFIFFMYLFFGYSIFKVFYLKVSHNNCEIEWCSENSSCFTKVAASPSLLIPNPNCFFGQFLLRRVCLIVEYATLTFDPILDTFALYVNYSSCNVICVLILVH